MNRRQAAILFTLLSACAPDPEPRRPDDSSAPCRGPEDCPPSTAFGCGLRDCDGILVKVCPVAACVDGTCTMASPADCPTVEEVGAAPAPPPGVDGGACTIPGENT